MAEPMPEVEVDDLELRIRIEESTTEALELADRMAEWLARPAAGERSRLAANYLQLRTQIRGLKRLLTAAVAG